MFSLFLRITGHLALATIVTLLLVRFALDATETETALQVLRGHAQLQALTIAQTPPSERRERAKEISRILGYGVQLEPSLGTNSTRAEWRGTQVYVIAPVPNSEGQLALGPVPAGKVADFPLALGLALLISLLLGALTTWPIRKRIRSLESLAERMRSGDFRARLPREDGDAFDSVAASLNSLADRIGQLLADERDLLRTVAHEVRAPIARMRFRVEKIHRRADEEGKKDGSGLVGDLAQVDNLFEELLTYVAFDEFHQDGPRLTTTKIAVRSAVARVVEEVTAVSEEISVSIEGSDECEIEANLKLFDRSVTNLLLNAIAYGGPRIVIQIRSSDDYCVVDVQDSGPGIPVLDRPQVIKPFVRLNSKKKKGTGLGLAIVSRIMRLHGGHLYIVDAPGGGASIQLAWQKRPPPFQRSGADGWLRS